MSLDVPVRYGYHPETPEQTEKLKRLHAQYLAFVDVLEVELPDGRYKGIGLRKMEEALQWHRMAILTGGE